ncbi:hypothetical protein EC844_12547 [Acinetobacter calcoaceticus]|uniref:Uncharacterized protein n=1 Tax=Acinetobacter calcoaceticus TaxID=471 RepID=A0A4R1XGQ6_ACICA|nr:hypothetical protein EC844_12547 [Acinetobacter calcoaceticus]
MAVKTVCEMLEDKFEEDILAFLNNFQRENDCKIDHWSFNPDDSGNYNLQIQINKQDSKYLN